MILDTIDHRHLYTSLGPLFNEAFKFLEKSDFHKLELGKHMIVGDDLFVIVMEYDSKEISECITENHKKYIDIQYMVEGEELMGVTLFSGQAPSVPYDETRDAAFYAIVHDSFIKVGKGQFTIFFPSDLHMPSVKIGTGSKVRKAVFKVRVS
jgi:YhcH/YjgK/YiaL family protein